MPWDTFLHEQRAQSNNKVTGILETLGDLKGLLKGD